MTPTVRHEIAATVRLATPVMISRVGILTLVSVDSAMTGHAGAEELAYYALAMAVQTPIMMLGIGLVMGTVILTAQAHGAGRSVRGGEILSSAVCIAAVIGLVAAMLLSWGEPLLAWLRQPPDLAVGAASALAIIGWGIPGVLLHACATFFLEGIGRPIPGMVVMLVANVVNIALNYALIFGHWGAPEMGADGAALATTIVRTAAALALLIFVAVAIDRRQHGLQVRPRVSVLRNLFALGVPVGLSLGLESGAFATMMVFAGWLGEIQTAAFQIGFNLVAVPFMAALGLSTAASIRVGYAFGRGDATGMRRAGWTAVGLVVGFEALVSVVIFTWPNAFAGLYSEETDVLLVAIPAVIVAAIVLIPDAVQTVCIGALRGLSDVWTPTLLFLVSFWGVMVPAGYWLGVVAGHGAAGLMGGIAAGCVAAALCLLVRFQRVTRERALV
ncbi:MAG: MATE family efflux transporter [Gammaproteobacteria bacterium]|nr:MATE family efflux transporter [Gammaproteobacteria bacterium]